MEHEDQVKDLHVEAWVDGKDESYDRFAVDVRRHDGAEGLQNVYLVLFRKELHELLYEGKRMATDGYHRLEVQGDDWTFYDQPDVFRRRSGVAQVPYLTLNLPRSFMRALYRHVRGIWRAQRAVLSYLQETDQYAYLERVKIPLSPERLAQARCLFGQGKGLVRLDVTPETQAFLEERMAYELKEEARSSLSDRIDRVTSIARNSTWGHHQTATVRLSKDWDGFYWVAYAPDGRSIMNGGIVDHGRRADGSRSELKEYWRDPEHRPDWGVHT